MQRVSSLNILFGEVSSSRHCATLMTGIARCLWPFLIAVLDCGCCIFCKDHRSEMGCTWYLKRIFERRCIDLPMRSTYRLFHMLQLRQKPLRLIRFKMRSRCAELSMCCVKMCCSKSISNPQHSTPKLKKSNDHGESICFFRSRRRFCS